MQKKKAMFNKLLSNLPFNPSLIGQVSFYAKRLHQETSIRRLGFFFVGLAFVVQIVAIISPPQPSLALSDNDVIRGGFASREQAAQLCRTNQQDFATILANFAITCDHVANAQVVNVRSTDENNQLYSMGRKPYGKLNETPVKIKGLNETFYMRPLSSWDSGHSSTYKALSLGNAFGVHYYILFNCGNLVQTGKPAAPPTPKPVAPVSTTPTIMVPKPEAPKTQTATKPCPAAHDEQDALHCLTYSKSARNLTQEIADANGTVARGGDVILYTLSVKNTGTVTVKDVAVEENVSDVLEYATIVNSHNGSLSRGIMYWPKATIGPGQTISRFLTVKVKNPVPATPVSASDPGSFDLVMTNVFGNNTVNIKLAGGIVKAAEVTTKTLPNTGPGSTVAIGATLSAIVGYFYFRARLLAQELDIVRKEYASHGGA